MARQEKTAESGEAATVPPDDEDAPLTGHGDDILEPYHDGASAEATKKVADPRPWMTANLCGYSGGPAAHLLRSDRFRHYGEKPYSGPRKLDHPASYT